MKERSYVVKLPNIDFMMDVTKEYLNGEMDVIDYSLDFPYELDKRYQKMHREDDDYCELIYERLYKEGVVLCDKLSDEEFKKLIRKQYNYIKKIAKEGSYPPLKAGISPLPWTVIFNQGRGLIPMKNIRFPCQKYFK